MVGLADLVPRSYLVTLTEMYNRLVLKGLGTRLRFRNNYVSSKVNGLNPGVSVVCVV